MVDLIAAVAAEAARLDVAPGHIVKTAKKVRAPKTATGALEGTDLGNSERFVTENADRLRYVREWETFAVWTGQVWCVDRSGVLAEDMAKRTASAAALEAITAMQAAQEELGAAQANHDEVRAERARGRLSAAEGRLSLARRMQAAVTITAMLKLSRSDQRIAISFEDLDADPWLLNVENGTVDLRTGMLRPHLPLDLCTRVAPVRFDPDAVCPLWDRFIARAMAESGELVAYLARFVGYALTGVIREHVLAFFFGGGANGKSTFLALLLAMLGDYAGPAARGILFRSRGERHPTELADLHGKRFVVCSEIEEGLSFDEALTKDLTGGDAIKARRMREDFWSFAPTHKLAIAGNHKPMVRGDDDGIWRRIRLIPWSVQIPEAERDPMLPEKLRAELPGILAWAVRGCLEWQRTGLDEPASVRAATADYRKDSDTLGEFLALNVVLDADGRISGAKLRTRYAAWCEAEGHIAVGAKRFAGRLKAAGARKTTMRDGSAIAHGWAGVRERTAMDPSPCSDVARIEGHSGVSSLREASLGVIPERPATSRYSATASGDTFGDWLESEAALPESRLDPSSPERASARHGVVR